MVGSSPRNISEIACAITVNSLRWSLQTKKQKISGYAENTFFFKSYCLLKSSDKICLTRHFANDDLSCASNDPDFLNFAINICSSISLILGISYKRLKHLQFVFSQIIVSKHTLALNVFCGYFSKLKTFPILIKSSVSKFSSGQFSSS